ncbi:MAG: bifunctional phosphopantothenoylcysteine decarboxylase/phosphopantothenate--cysteine ligase CoaBC [Chloroflexi bacterium]|mgnify:FL=1|nr:bifunctional phosphopantothenoylcysteine decarboxylase/phosphopantothenate--cysteine ligase CoaBC [Chloroflexota bacterium]|tara:strand:- start:301 stop:1533 length:1233 start_codon:yes stop_codon:yes gene_type:complete
MSSIIENRQITVGVTGSIAAYKIVDVVSKLVQQGAVVDVAMTSAAVNFISPLTFQSLTGREPYVDMWGVHGVKGEAHIELARRTELMLIAPATASTMASLAHGFADDFVTLTALATKAPLLISPAMDSQMWDHDATQANLKLLRERGAHFIGPEQGRLASGQIGTGRLSESQKIIATMKACLGKLEGDFSGKTVIVTAGGTREAIDPVRYIGNRSSGKMGNALAEAARDRGADVVLITTVPETAPEAIQVIPVESANEMESSISDYVTKAEVLVMAAAVADYRVNMESEQKIKREHMKSFSLDLIANKDIIASIDANLIKVAFAAETEDLITNAKKKLRDKNVDLVIANSVTGEASAFGSDTNKITIVDNQGNAEELPVLSKYICAMEILDRISNLVGADSYKEEGSSSN